MKETKNIYERPDTDKSKLEIHCEALTDVFPATNLTTILKCPGGGMPAS